MLARIDTTADVPSAAVEAFRRRLTETVVRVAEALRRPDDVYHLLARDPSAEETDVLPVGPQIQELAERLHLVLGRPPMAGRTAVWMALPRFRRQLNKAVFTGGEAWRAAWRTVKSCLGPRSPGG